MENNHASSQQSNSFCKKISKAFSKACPLKKTRPVNYQYQNPVFPGTHNNHHHHHHHHGRKIDAKDDKDYRRSGTELNNKISDYIHRAGKKIRTTSFVGHDHADHVHKVDENDKGSHLDDRATDFINRAKRKIRATTSSVGMGKRVTFKSNEKHVD